jgi:hypothetical protein
VKGQKHLVSNHNCNDSSATRRHPAAADELVGEICIPGSRSSLNRPFCLEARGVVLEKLCGGSSDRGVDYALGTRSTGKRRGRRSEGRKRRSKQGDRMRELGEISIIREKVVSGAVEREIRWWLLRLLLCGFRRVEAKR